MRQYIVTFYFMSLVAVASAFQLARPVARSTVLSAQAEYGVTSDPPETHVRCGKCQSVFFLSEDDLGRGKGRRL